MNWLHAYSIVSLKEEFLRLLKENEEFRLAVAAYLGIRDLTPTLERLVRAVHTLRKSIVVQSRQVKSQTESISLLESTVKYQGEKVEALEKAAKTQGEKLDSLESAVKELVKAVEALREVSAKHEERLREQGERIGELVKAVEALREVSAKHEERLSRVEKRLTRIERDVRSIKSNLDKYSISLEEEANEVIGYLLKQRGYHVPTGPASFDTRYEFDIYGTNGRLTVIGEAKVRAGTRTIKHFLERANSAMSKWPERFPGTVIKVLYCLRAMPEAVKEAESAKIWLIESTKEKTRFEIVD